MIVGNHDPNPGRHTDRIHSGGQAAHTVATVDFALQRLVQELRDHIISENQ
jgi:hypothetical protein